MIPKDYYKILEVKHNANPTEIKRSYRRLAMKYHPDRNQGDSMAGEVFREVTEAYSILSDPALRRGYDYQGTQYDEVHIVSKADVVKKINALQQTVKAADPFRTNRDGILYSIVQILSPANIWLLEKDSSHEETTRVVNQLLQCCVLLSLTQLQKVTPYLYNVAGDDAAAKDSIARFLQKSKSSGIWEKYKTLVAVVVAVILCLLIFLLTPPSAP